MPDLSTLTPAELEAFVSRHLAEETDATLKDVTSLLHAMMARGLAVHQAEPEATPARMTAQAGAVRALSRYLDERLGRGTDEQRHWMAEISEQICGMILAAFRSDVPPAPEPEWSDTPVIILTDRRGRPS